MRVIFPSLRAQRSNPCLVWIAASAFSLLAMTMGGCSQKNYASTISYGTTAGAGSAGIHTVLEGDTVYSIAQAYQLPMRDIITLNNMSEPYDLATGYRVKLPAPHEYKVRPGDSLRDVARLHDVSISELARLNHLQSPYHLQAGQILRMPTSVTNPEYQATSRARAARASAGTVAAVERQSLNSASSSAVPQPESKPAAQPVSLSPKIPARSGNGKFMMPVDGNIVSTYGPKADGLHNDGINIKAPKGTPVRAAENGVVMYAGNELEGYGNLVLVRHEDGWMSAYAHMDKFLVKKGETVRRGQSIGTVGSSGQVDTSQLHFEIRRGTEAKDPMPYL